MKNRSSQIIFDELDNHRFGRNDLWWSCLIEDDLWKSL